MLLCNLLIIKTVKKDKRANNSMKYFGYFPSVAVNKHQLQNLIYNLSTDFNIQKPVWEIDKRCKPSNSYRLMHQRLVVLPHFGSFCTLCQKQVRSKQIDVLSFIAEVCYFVYLDYWHILTSLISLSLIVKLS